MYIPIEHNSRGDFEITQAAFNKLLHLTATNNLPKELGPKDIWVDTEIYQENLLYVLIKVTLPTGFKSHQFDEKQMIRQIEAVTMQTFNTKPKNIALAYSHR